MFAFADVSRLQRSLRLNSRATACGGRGSQSALFDILAPPPPPSRHSILSVVSLSFFLSLRSSVDVCVRDWVRLFGC